MEDAERRGLHFCWSGELKSCLGLFNLDELCFEVTISKVWRNLSPNTNQSPRCPNVNCLYAWDLPQGIWRSFEGTISKELIGELSAERALMLQVQSSQKSLQLLNITLTKNKKRLRNARLPPRVAARSRRADNR